MADKRRIKGATTRDRILSVAVDIASAEGLEGLTIGRLARETGMSKSGLFAHFGSKQELQLAAVDRASAIFIEKVIEPTLGRVAGLPRLYAMQSRWIDYVEDDTFRGGCFFAAASAEFDGRPGPVRERIASLTRYWRELLETEVARARDLGHVDSTTDPVLLAFQLHAFLQEANWAYQLFDDQKAFEQARSATEKLLRAVVTPGGLRSTKERRVLSARAVDHARARIELSKGDAQ